MFSEALILLVFIGGMTCAITILVNTKAILDERLFGANEDNQESYDW